MAAYDIVTVGGGVAGSVLGKAMAERGYRVLIVERETEFKDRVRGEFVFPWGVAEAKHLGVYDALIQAGGHHPKYWTDYAGPDPLPSRDFAEDTPQRLRGLCIYHPRMQDALIEAAEAAGAEVRRGVRVRAIEPGRQPRVLLDGHGGPAAVTARLAVGADGRSSLARKWGSFDAREDPPGNLFAGVLVENAPASAENSICMLNPSQLRIVLYLPQSDHSGRAYLGSRGDTAVRLSGGGFLSFLRECAASGLAPGLLDGARQAGPLATFDGAESSVGHPYKNGIALVGDAAATSDPTWGQGLSLTLRDIRALRDALLADDDWDAAGHAYAAAHDYYYDKVRTAVSWFTQLFMQPGQEADALRARALPQMASDPFFLPDTLIAGPDLAPPTPEYRAKLFGERH
ncbi:MAG: FAD-dependent monooxygenase [Bryobacteraceae bacterium]|nr:FAD-dependent monooxygenase [Bryobacteraceae bacterium]